MSNVVAIQSRRIRELEELIIKIEKELPEIYDGMHLVDCPYVSVLTRIRDLINSSKGVMLHD